MKGLTEGMLMLVGIGGLVAFLLMQVLGFGLPVDMDVSQSFSEPQAQGSGGAPVQAALGSVLAGQVDSAQAAEPQPVTTKKQLAQREAQVAAQKEKLAGQEERLAGQEEQLTEREAQLNEQAASLAEREAAMAQAQTNLQATAQELDQRQAQITATELAQAEEARRLQALALELDARGKVQEQEADRQEVIAGMLSKWAAHLQELQAQVQAEQEKLKEMKLMVGGLAALSGVLTLASAAWVLRRRG